MIKLSSYLEKYFDKQPDIKFSARQLQNLQQPRRHTAVCIHVTCLQIQQIVMVHGGVREVQPDYSECQIEYVIF